MNVSRHRKPIANTPSSFITKTFSKWPAPKSFPILDLACGYGRHSIYFSSMGYKVFSADAHKEVLNSGWIKSVNNVYPIILDGMKPLPFRDKSFGAIVIVHFYFPGLFSNIKKLVAHGGMIYYESIGGQGDNWTELDKCQQVKNELFETFEMLIYKEKHIGPKKQYATLKMLARNTF